MQKSALPFSGTVPQNYDDLLGPFLFEPYALELVQRVVHSGAKDILELACGTGRVTKHLVDNIPKGSYLTATDLNPDMLAIAKTRVSGSTLRWEKVDMTAIPYLNSSYDLIICQFGLMLVPDKIKALAEIFRVLRPGGKLIFSVWSKIENNQVWDISSKIFNSFFGETAWDIYQGPFSMHDSQTGINLLKHAGFEKIKVDDVLIMAETTDADIAAKGFIQGLPIAGLAGERGADLLPEIQEKLRTELIKKLGDRPLKSSLDAWVFEAWK
jgi:ubiquinone/menaquinone biosynthesis C-methylase UbiE